MHSQGVDGSSSDCDPGAYPTIERYFGDCVYDTRDLVGFSLGLCSILAWLVAQLPQLVTNYRRKSADALSPFFIAEWLLGDTCNLLGALLKGDQPATVVLTAQYFICVDCVMMLQYLYYTSLARRRERTYALSRRRHHHHRHHHHHHHTQQGGPEGTAADVAEIMVVPAGQSGQGGGVAAAASGSRTLRLAGTAAAGVLLLAGGPRLQASSPVGARGLRRLLGGKDAFKPSPQLISQIGSGLGYVSCVLYLASRGAQIQKNRTRHRAEGLASSMFLCAITANCLSGSALLLRSRGWNEVLDSLPWLLGSLGTVFLDVVILAQTYGRGEKKHGSDEEEPLIPASSATTHPGEAPPELPPGLP